MYKASEFINNRAIIVPRSLVREPLDQTAGAGSLWNEKICNST